MIVSIQGQAGSYHDIARREYFQNGHELLARDTFEEVFADVDTGRADFALVAAENSLYGSINEVYDLLLKYHLWISGEVYNQIHHCLLTADADGDLAGIKEIYSHPVALAQCETFLQEHLPGAKRFAEHDTAGSAEAIAAHPLPHQAAIASEQAAELHGLQILARQIETNHHNYTRFIVLQKERADAADAHKTSIILRTSHRPGALYYALGEFNSRDINLSKLESRPIVGEPWKYQFYIDFEAGIDDPAAQSALKNLQGDGNTVTVLGSYRANPLAADDTP